jgi:hypothetical protein
VKGAGFCDHGEDGGDILGLCGTNFHGSGISPVHPQSNTFLVVWQLDQFHLIVVVTLL